MRACSQLMHACPALPRSACRGLSEVHSLENMFPRAAAPSLTQRFALWKWRNKRDHVLPKFATMGKIAVQQKVLGEWPTVPETQRQAAERYLAALTEILELAQEGNVLLVTHAEVGAGGGGPLRMVPMLGNAKLACVGHMAWGWLGNCVGHGMGAWLCRSCAPPSPEI